MGSNNHQMSNKNSKTTTHDDETNKENKDCNVSLEQHQNVTKVNSDIKDNDDDEFYNVLRQRVISKLHEKGIDPIMDRGATPSRVIYYMLIVSGCMISGYYHITVSAY